MGASLVKALGAVAVLTFLAGAASGNGGGTIVLGTVLAVWLLVLWRLLGSVPEL